jgi:hypothetical protein
VKDKVKKNFLSVILLILAILLILIPTTIFLLDKISKQKAIKETYEKIFDNIGDYTILALADNDINYCEKKQNADTREKCVEDFISLSALRKKDISLCSNLDNTNIKNMCLAFLEKDISKCSSIEQEYLCRALVSNDASICSSSANTTECSNDFYYLSAIGEQDAALCELIIQPFAKAKCEAVVKGDSSIYKEFVKEKVYDHTYINIALSTLDESLCKKIKDNVIKQACIGLYYDMSLFFLGIKKQSWEGCSNISKIDIKTACLNILSLEKNGCEITTNLKLVKDDVRCLIQAAEDSNSANI